MFRFTPKLFLAVVGVLVLAGVGAFLLHQNNTSPPPLPGPVAPSGEADKALPPSELPGSQLTAPLSQPPPPPPSGTTQPPPSITPPPPKPPPPPPPPAQTVVSRVVEGDDNGLYPASISVPKGALVQLTLKARSTNVYYGGLEFRSSQFMSGTILPGESKTVTFTADNTFSFSSYWPASGVKKADGMVVVQ